jgi:hypothetical protein
LASRRVIATSIMDAGAKSKVPVEMRHRIKKGHSSTPPSKLNPPQKTYPKHKSRHHPPNDRAA